MLPTLTNARNKDKEAIVSIIKDNGGKITGFTALKGDIVEIAANIPGLNEYLSCYDAIDAYYGAH